LDLIRIPAIIATIIVVTAAAPAMAQVGATLNLGEPGFYGRLDIGNLPPPRLIYREPRAVDRVDANRAPIYMHVPPGHAKNWRRHCRDYNACGERVLFVQDRWYSREYVPRYQEMHRPRPDDGRDGRRDDPRRGDDRNDRPGGERDREPNRGR
jgi:hypothetical protein